MEQLNMKIFGWTLAVCLTMGVAMVYGQTCSPITLGHGTIEMKLLDDTVHVPLYVGLTIPSARQCLEMCSRVDTCQYVNHNKATGECRLLNVAPTDTITSTPDAAWAAIPYTSLGTAQFGCATNTCDVDEQCFDNGLIGPICAVFHS